MTKSTTLLSLARASQARWRLWLPRRTAPKTLLIEKLNRLGGTSRYSGLDFACVGSDMQKAAGITDTPEAMVADMAKVAANLSDRERALNIARETARAQKIMLEHGVKWTKILKLGGHSEKRCLIAEGGGSGILRSLWASYERYPNLKVSPATKLDELILDEKGGVIGVEVRKDYLFDASLASDDRENHSGTKVRIGARQAVIMATGGYARDKEFMKHEVPFLEHTLNSASEGATSGALKSMIRAGARPVQLSLYRFSFALPTEDLIWGVAIDAATGARYASEALGRNPISTTFSPPWPRGVPSPTSSGMKGPDKVPQHGSSCTKHERSERSQRHDVQVRDARRGCGFYNTDAAKLKATITEYNRMIAAGKDEQFMKPLERSGRKVEPLSETGPFYTALMIPRWDYCPGGIATDTTARALRLADSEPVPGLFVVGEAAGGIHGAERLTACSMPDCCVTGMIAGETAAKLQKRTI